LSSEIDTPFANILWLNSFHRRFSPFHITAFSFAMEDSWPPHSSFVTGRSGSQLLLPPAQFDSMIPALRPRRPPGRSLVYMSDSTVVRNANILPLFPSSNN
jgi:hypothetical protein